MSFIKCYSYTNKCISIVYHKCNSTSEFNWEYTFYLSTS